MEDWDRVRAKGPETNRAYDAIGDIVGLFMHGSPPPILWVASPSMEPLADQAIVKGWYPLTDKDGAAAKGEVYLVLQWRRNRDLAFEPQVRGPDEAESSCQGAQRAGGRCRTAVIALTLRSTPDALIYLRGQEEFSYQVEVPRTRSSRPVRRWKDRTLKPFKTKPKKKVLDPVWHEQLARASRRAKSLINLCVRAKTGTRCPAACFHKSIDAICHCVDLGSTA